MSYYHILPNVSFQLWHVIITTVNKKIEHLKRVRHEYCDERKKGTYFWTMQKLNSPLTLYEDTNQRSKETKSI